MFDSIWIYDKFNKAVFFLPAGQEISGFYIDNHMIILIEKYLQNRK